MTPTWPAWEHHRMATDTFSAHEAHGIGERLGIDWAALEEEAKRELRRG